MATQTSMAILKQLGTVITHEQDDHIFLSGEVGDALYLLLKGNVEIYLTSEIDGRIIPLAELHEGDVFGEMALIRDSVRSASAKSKSGSICLKIPKHRFEDFIALEPKFAVNMMKTLAKRHYDTLEKCHGYE